MKLIKNLVDMINEELESAECYSERYLEAKAEGKDTNYREMANEELQHAIYIHDEAVEKIKNLQSIFTPPIDMQQKWDEEHSKYIEKTAEIKRMLSM